MRFKALAMAEDTTTDQITLMPIDCLQESYGNYQNLIKDLKDNVQELQYKEITILSVTNFNDDLELV